MFNLRGDCRCRKGTNGSVLSVAALHVEILMTSVKRRHSTSSPWRKSHLCLFHFLNEKPLSGFHFHRPTFSPLWLGDQNSGEGGSGKTCWASGTLFYKGVHVGPSCLFVEGVRKLWGMYWFFKCQRYLKHFTSFNTGPFQAQWAL